MGNQNVCGMQNSAAHQRLIWVFLNRKYLYLTFMWTTPWYWCPLDFALGYHDEEHNVKPEQSRLMRGCLLLLFITKMSS